MVLSSSSSIATANARIASVRARLAAVDWAALIVAGGLERAPDLGRPVMSPSYFFLSSATFDAKCLHQEKKKRSSKILEPQIPPTHHPSSHRTRSASSPVPVAAAAPSATSPPPLPDNSAPSQRARAFQYRSTMEQAQAPSQVEAVRQQEDEEEEVQSYTDLDVITKHGVTKTDVNKFKDAGFKTVSAPPTLGTRCVCGCPTSPLMLCLAPPCAAFGPAQRSNHAWFPLVLAAFALPHAPLML
jgi:hypothetical protein